MRFQLILSCLLTLLLPGFAFMLPTAKPDTIRVSGGLITGTTGTTSRTGEIRIFKGIPFAAPPVGEFRWKAPQPVRAWSGVRKCDQFGPSPMQGKPSPFGPWSAEYLIPETPISEDCLYLNVWSGSPATKAGAVPEKRPVVVWIYGGGFNSGGSGCAIYDGEAMAHRGIVFVSLNYRVGPFGFMAHPELTKESGHNASGNYGLLDQLAALQWVKQNIAVFGGDPTNITIAGQSAGSMSVNCLVASPLAKGLFTKAIAQSGAGFGRFTQALGQAEESGLKTMQALGVASLAAMRAQPADAILKHAQGVRGPVIDGYVLPQSLLDLFAAGRQNQISLLTGWNEDEGLGGAPKSADAFRKQLDEQYGAKAADLLTHYPAGTDEEAAHSQANLSRDMTFGVQNYRWANLESQQKHPVWVYRFTRKLPATGEYARYGAFHTGEVAYAYDNLRFINRTLRPLNTTDDQLARTMSSYWANFIKTGNPNGNGLPDWPGYTTDRKQIMVLGDQCKAQPLPDAATLDFMLSLTTPR